MEERARHFCLDVEKGALCWRLERSQLASRYTSLDGTEFVDGGVGRAGSPSRAGSWLEARFPTGGSEIRPYHDPSNPTTDGNGPQAKY